MNEKITSNIIARDTEQKLLKDLLESNTAEFLAIYGRRRIGKTFLIREFFKASLDISSKQDDFGFWPKEVNYCVKVSNTGSNFIG